MAAISLANGVIYRETFDALSNTAMSTTNALTIPGFVLTETGGSARDNELYGVDTGGSNTADVYSYGAAGATDRALGALRSGTLSPVFGAEFSNGGSAAINRLEIGYTGEQWRLGTAGRQDRLDFQISFDATSLTTGTWIDVNQLDFASPNTTTTGAKDGNDAANRTALSFTLDNLNIPAGTTFWVRWIDLDATGADDGLAVDDFAITAFSAPVTPVMPTISIDDVTRSEADGAITFTVSLSAPAPAGGVTFDIATTDGTATSVGNGDFTARSLTGQTIVAGATSVTFTVQLTNDATPEQVETFTVDITNVVGATLGDGQGVGTITSDDTSYAIAAGAASEATGAVPLVVTRTGLLDAATLTYTVSLGATDTASAADFPGALATGTVSFAAGSDTATISVPVVDDAGVEGDETFTVTLSGATGGQTITTASATGTILNDDALAPAGNVGIADLRIVEGNAGTSVAIVTLTRGDGTGAFDVSYATSNGGAPRNAAATAGSDYVAASGVVRFAEGQTTATIALTINGDTAAELSEEFTVTLSGATNGATIGDATGVVTIATDDALTTGPATAWINEFHYDDSTASGDVGEFVEIAAPAGSDLSEYTVVRYNGNPATAATVYSTPAQTNTPSGPVANQANGIGTAAFFFATNGLQNGATDGFALVRTVGGVSTVVEFLSYEGVITAAEGPAAGMTSIDVGVAETNTTAPGSSLGRTGGPGSAFVVMTDDTPGQINIGQTIAGGAVAMPTVTVSDATVNEQAGTIAFTITRANVAAGAFTVDYATADGTAIAGSDYGATSGTVSFADNQVSAIVTVAISDDATPELNETLLLNLANATGGAVISDAQGIGTIVNDDGAPIQVAINDVSIDEGNDGTSTATFTVTRTGGTGAFSVNFATVDGSATAGSDYGANSGTLLFAAGQTSQTVSVTINGDRTTEPSETFRVLLSGATADAVILDDSGTGTIVNDEAIFIHDIQGTAYYSPILAADGITGFNIASTTTVTVRAVVTAVDNDGDRQGYYISEETADWDANPFTSEGIFVQTRNDAGVGTVVSGVAVGDVVRLTANVMEYQAFSSLPRTILVNATDLSIVDRNAPLPTVTLTGIPNEVLTRVTPDFTDSADGVGDTFDASTYALSYFETVEGMLVTIPNMVVADGFVSSAGGQPFFQAYSLDSANPDQINSRGGYTVAGDPPVGPPNTDTTGDDTIQGGRHLHDGDVNPDIIEVDFSGFAIDAPAGLAAQATMGDRLGDITGIIDFDFSDRKLFVTDYDPAGFVNTVPVQEVTAFGDDARALTVATFNVENLDPGDGAARFTALARVIATNLNAPDIVTIEEIQDNNGAAQGSADASMTWQMLVTALNLATGKTYQWVDQEPVPNSDGGQPGGNIRVGFLYDTARVQLGNLAADAPLAERRRFTDRIGDGTRDAGDLIRFSDDMVSGEINTADWSATRKSLLGEFTFAGNVVYVIGNHFSAKGGSGEFWQLNQNIEAGEPENAAWAKRTQQAEDVWQMMNLVQTTLPQAGVIAGGDINEFYFYRPLEVLTGYAETDGTARVGGTRFDNLTLTLSEAERYTYTFDGRSQAIDHIIVSQGLAAVADYDVVHTNTGYNANGTGADASPRLSDHDPGIASFDFSGFGETLFGTAGNDAIDGMGGNDILRLGQGGDEDVDGGDGADAFLFGTTLTAADRVDGGAGRDVLGIQGNYAGLTLGAANLVDVETLTLISGADARFGDTANARYSYVVTSIDANVGAGQQLIVNGGALRATENLTFDGSAESNGTFLIYGGLGTDVLTGGAGADIFFLADGRYTAGDRFIGGAGADIVVLRGDYTVTLAANTLTGIETVALNSAADTRFFAGGERYSYSVTSNNGNVVAGAILTINGGRLQLGETLTFDGRAELDGTFRIFGGAANDVLAGGAGDDLIFGGGSGDTLTGGGGSDVFRYDNPTDSNQTERDGIQDFTLGDVIDLSRIDADSLTDGNQAFSLIDGAAFSRRAGELRFENTGGPIWLVQGDVNGDGVADFEILVVLTDNNPITATDFIL